MNNNFRLVNHAHQVHNIITSRPDLPTWAYRNMHEKTDWVVLDTETTGLPGEVCDIAIVSHSGEILLDTLIKPTIPIPSDATRIHHISDADVWAAPTFADVWPRIKAILDAHPRIITYNSSFDYNCIRLSATRNDIVIERGYVWTCMMKSYAWHYGGPRARWMKLERACECEGVELHAAHRALSDTLATYNLIKALATQAKGVDIDVLKMKKGTIEL